MSSVEVNNFLKIDENQNEEIENDELPDSPVSRNCLLTVWLIFFPNYGGVFINFLFSYLPDVPKFTKFTGWGHSVSSLIKSFHFKCRQQQFYKIYTPHLVSVKILITSLFVYIRIKPCDFDYLKIIGKGSFGKVSASNFSFMWLTSLICCHLSFPSITPSLMQMFALLQVLLARHKESTKYYAVKVLQKKIIMKKKEVRCVFLPYQELETPQN